MDNNIYVDKEERVMDNSPIWRFATGRSPTRRFADSRFAARCFADGWFTAWRFAISAPPNYHCIWIDLLCFTSCVLLLLLLLLTTSRSLSRFFKRM